MKKKFEDTSLDELRAELKRLRENLCDLEDMHSFTFGRTSVHIGAEKAQNMQREFEEECNEHNEKIAAVERLLKVKGKG
ncbi:MAG TPA: hypothetical protein VI956_09775 [Nitrospirota bacterium]|nr:hypothetical protein [Nitrospirota bacterium]